MKLSLTQHNTTVTIEAKGDVQTCYDMAQYCRELLLGQGYHWNSIEDALPTEEDVCKIVEEALEDHIKEEMPDKEEVLYHHTS